MTTQQTFLPFECVHDMTFANFYLRGNELPARAVYRSATGRGEALLYLWGESGAGRSHLLRAACEEAQRSAHGSIYISFRDRDSFEAGVLGGLEQLDLICLDDVECIAGDDEWETALLDLLNRVKDAQRRLIVASRYTPQECGFRLRDLVSRLAAGAIFQVMPLRDQDKGRALRLRALQRGIKLTTPVARFILSQSDRDMPALVATFDKLCQASLTAKRRITIPFIKEVLAGATQAPTAPA